MDQSQRPSTCPWIRVRGWVQVHGLGSAAGYLSMDQSQRLGICPWIRVRGWVHVHGSESEA
eukprot:6195887-Pleurochrysis_carterae.AAC.1